MYKFIDYLLGRSGCKTVEKDEIKAITGLTDKAIDTLVTLSSNNGTTIAGHNEMNTLNLLLSDLLSVVEFLGGLEDFLNVRYKIPVYHTGEHVVVDNYTDELHTIPIDRVSVPECIVPDNDFDVIKGTHGSKNTYMLTLAQDSKKPYDNYQIALTDNFFESVALNSIEKSIINLRNVLLERK